MKGIADTGFIVAFLNRTDRDHAWARRIEPELTPPLLTCEAVLAEAVFHLETAVPVIGLVADGFLRPDFDCRRHLAQLAWLAEKYADLKPDFADLCLIRLAEVHPRHHLVTTDARDFGVYRKNRNEPTPLVKPR